MSTIELYQQLAENAAAMSEQAPDEHMRAMWLKLAAGYTALAHHVSRHKSPLQPADAPSLDAPSPDAPSLIPDDSSS
jgi:hypothetical protein